MKMVSIEDAVELYGKSRDTISVTACNYIKEHGVHPKWYVKGEKGSILVDIDYLNIQGRVDRECWLWNTDPEYGIYWALTEHFGLSDLWMSKWLADRSERYNEPTSWRTFFSNGLFRVPSEKGIYPRINMGIEFFLLGTRLIYLLIKEEKRLNF